MPNNYSEITKDLEKLGNKEKAKIMQGFFKTGKGEYGEGDVFLGVKVPEQRKVAKKHENTDIKSISQLLKSRVHEHRLAALLILVRKFQKAEEKEKKEIFDFYLKNTICINNWDLVDLTADKIAGAFLLDKDKSILYKLAKSKSLWERRIAIISTFNFIKHNRFEDALKISEILLKDRHDLIQKAVGWMLREIGKRNQEIEENFLNQHYKNMPRTMLRYAIERFPEKKRKFYLNWPSLSQQHKGKS